MDSCGTTELVLEKCKRLWPLKIAIMKQCILYHALYTFRRHCNCTLINNHAIM